MSSQRSFFVTDTEDERPILVERLNRGASSLSQANQMDSLPREVFGPVVPPRVVKSDFPIRLWIDGGLPCAFSQRARDAGQGDGIWNIYWISRNTKTQKQLTNYSKLNAFVRYPAWSPVGNQIVYELAETTGNIWLRELK